MILELEEFAKALCLGAAYRARFQGKRLEVIWDRVVEGRIRGVSENYIQVTAAAEGRRAGQLDGFVYG